MFSNKRFLLSVTVGKMSSEAEKQVKPEVGEEVVKTTCTSALEQKVMQSPSAAMNKKAGKGIMK